MVSLYVHHHATARSAGRTPPAGDVRRPVNDGAEKIRNPLARRPRAFVGRDLVQLDPVGILASREELHESCRSAWFSQA